MARTLFFKGGDNRLPSKTLLAIVPSGDFKNPSEIFSSVVIAAICQDIRYRSIIDKTMLAATPAAPKGTMTRYSLEATPGL